LQTSEPARVSKTGIASLVKTSSQKQYHEEQLLEDTCQKKISENVNTTISENRKESSLINSHTFSENQKKSKKDIFPTRNFYTFCNSSETSVSECTSSVSSCDDISLNESNEKEISLGIFTWNPTRFV
jgi:hypothetical protein